MTMPERSDERVFEKMVKVLLRGEKRDGCFHCEMLCKGYKRRCAYGNNTAVEDDFTFFTETNADDCPETFFLRMEQASASVRSFWTDVLNFPLPIDVCTCIVSAR